MQPGSPMTKIATFYDEAMIADSESYSPGSSKPRPVVQAYLDERLPIEIKSFEPATREELALAHDPEYVRDILDLRRPNGFGNFSRDVARSLPYTSGAELAAARHALVHGVACAPVCGFHHAHYDVTGGFCTFNGLMVTAVKLLNEEAVKRILILDTDQHMGDGTDDILTRLGLFGKIDNMAFGRLYKVPEQADSYLRKLRDVAYAFPDYDLILFHTGVDCHVDDPLGGVLTTKQLAMRDRIVFEAARTAGIPLAWNLAGGYQKPVSKVVQLHVNTMKECVAAYLRPAA
jgi:acetoin utilization deacetylase AcuC-like enzyme